MVRGDLVQLDRLAVLLIQGGDERAVIGVNLGRLGQRSRLQLRRELVEELDGTGRRCARSGGGGDQQPRSQDTAQRAHAEERDDLAQGGSRVKKG